MTIRKYRDDSGLHYHPDVYGLGRLTDETPTHYLYEPITREERMRVQKNVLKEIEPMLKNRAQMEDIVSRW